MRQGPTCITNLLQGQPHSFLHQMVPPHLHQVSILNSVHLAPRGTDTEWRVS